MEVKTAPKIAFKTVVVATIILSSIIYTLLLFYFDEGRNSFKGIFDTGNIGALGFYTISMLGFTILVYQILKNFLRSVHALIISVLSGPVIGFSTIIGIFMLISTIF